MANGVRSATNVVTPPSPLRTRIRTRIRRGTSSRRVSAYFPGAGLGTLRNSLTVPLAWCWHPKSNLDLTMLWHSLAGQPLHKREEGSGIMPIRELFQCLAVTRRVQNNTRTWWSERIVRTALANYWTRRSGIWLVSSRIWDSPIIMMMTWSYLIGLQSWLQQVQLVYRHNTRPFLPLVKGLACQTTRDITISHQTVQSILMAYIHY